MAAKFPETPPPGEMNGKSAWRILREIVLYLKSLPTVEVLSKQGVVKFPIKFQVATKRPVFVALNGRTNKDDGTAVKVSGLTWRRESGILGGSTIIIEDVDGLTEGTNYTLTGICVGER